MVEVDVDAVVGCCREACSGSLLSWKFVVVSSHSLSVSGLIVER